MTHRVDLVVKVGKLTRHRQWAELLRAVSEPAAGQSSDALLRQAVELGLDVAPETMGCSVTSIDGDQYRTPIYSNSLALDLDQAQYRAGDGPCMAAAREHRQQHFDPRSDRARFPSFSEAVLDRGVHSSISLPLIGAAQPSAINLYASSRTAFDGERPQAVAGLLARCISALLTRPGVTDRSAEEPVTAGDIEAARARARLVTEAENALMSRHRLSRAAALNHLTGRSRAQSRSIFEIARETVDDATTEMTQ